MYNVGFRADGGKSVGMGHIMRCLSLAKEFRNKGYNVYFISKIEEGISKIKSQGFKVLELSEHSEEIQSYEGLNHSNMFWLHKEAMNISELIKKFHLDILFIDTYNVTEEYFLKIKPYVKTLAYIDDLNKFVYPVDILINGNITATSMNYTKYSQDQIHLLGLQYNLIRDEFKDLPTRKIKENVQSIMITMGGSDPHNLSSFIADSILTDEELCNLTINIIVGNGFTNKDKLTKIARRNSNVILHENVQYMSRVMLDSDIAISAGGSTLYELSACGTPTLAIVIADNQEFIVEKMDEYGYIDSLGWYQNLTANLIRFKVKQLLTNFKKRKHTSQKMQQLVDGKGTERIVSNIRSIL